MPWSNTAYLFLLGFASGLCVLVITSFRRISPTWLKLVLTAVILLTGSRYVVMALYTNPATLHRFWFLHPLWFGSLIGLTLPSIFAIDQLLRHPAITPMKLMKGYFPFLIAYIAIMVFGRGAPISDPTGSWIVQLDSVWQWVLISTQIIFVICFISACFLLINKIPNRIIRTALLILALGQLYLAFDSLLLFLGGWYFKPFLFSEIFMLLAIWWTYETAATAPELM